MDAGKQSGYKQRCLTNPPILCINLTNQVAEYDFKA